MPLNLSAAINLKHNNTSEKRTIKQEVNNLGANYSPWRDTKIAHSSMPTTTNWAHEFQNESLKRIPTLLANIQRGLRAQALPDCLCFIGQPKSFRFSLPRAESFANLIKLSKHRPPTAKDIESFGNWLLLNDKSGIVQAKLNIDKRGNSMDLLLV